MSARPRPFVIDADGHMIEPVGVRQESLDARRRSRAPWPVTDENGRFGVRVGDPLVMCVVASPAVRGKQSGRFKAPASWGADPQRRLADMDLEGIDVAVLSPTLAFFFPELGDPELHAALCRASNDWLADDCRVDSRRLLGVALRPLEDVEASIREQEGVTGRHGFRGAFVRPNPYAGRPIHHPAYDPFWDCARFLGVPITVHEGVSDGLPTRGRDRTDNPVFLHLMSHPFEQMAALAGLVYAGVLERFPDLRFVLLESGSGWAPYWLDRMDEHGEVWGTDCPP